MTDVFQNYSRQADFTIVPYQSIRSRRLAGLFFFCALTTEFFYIEVGGGALRPYHLLAPLYLLVFGPSLSRIFGMRSAVALLIFLLSTVLGVAASSSVSGAMTSSVLFFLNASIAIVFALILSSKWVTTQFLKNALIKLTYLTVCVAILQVIAMQGAGVAVGYLPSQIRQVEAGFAPSLFTEANTYAKFLITPALFLVPFFLNSEASRRERILGMLIVAVFLVNFMRTALFAFVVACLFIFVWYSFTRSFARILKRTALVAFVMTLTIYALLSSGLVTSEYSLYKFTTLLDINSFSDDGSWSFRAAAMSLAIEQTLSSPLRIAFGNGWGQVFAFLHNEVRQVGGADIVNVFAYNGVVGAAAFVFLILSSLFSAGRRAKHARNRKDKLIAEGVLFALVGNIVVGAMSGVLLMASFWLLIGTAIAFDVEHRKESGVMRQPGLRA